MSNDEKLLYVYNMFIDNIIKNFKISDIINFKNNIINHIKNREEGIENDKDKLEEWNDIFYGFIIKYSTLSEKEFVNMMKENLKILSGEK